MSHLATGLRGLASACSPVPPQWPAVPLFDPWLGRSLCLCAPFHLAGLFPVILQTQLRQREPEGNILRDRFKSFQKRNMIEPRERAKFKRKYKVKLVEKRAFREIQL